MANKGETYICEACGGEFETDWDEAQAQAEYQAKFPDAIKAGEPKASVCDDCYRKAMELMRRKGMVHG